MPPTILSPLRGSGGLSFNSAKGGLCQVIALCALCADIECFVVKKNQGTTANFNHKARMLSAQNQEWLVLFQGL